MKYSGLYFIPSHANTPEASHSTATSIVNNIESHFEHAVRQGPWSLTHRLFRSTNAPPNTNGQPQPPHQQLHHILHLSHLSMSRTYCYVHSFVPTASSTVKQESLSNAPTPQAPASQSSVVQRTDPGVIVSIPSQSTESHTSYLANQLSPLWALRHVLNLSNGVTYTTGQFTIHVGELKAVRNAASANTASPGVVVQISTIVDSDGVMEEDSEVQAMGYSLVSEAEGDSKDAAELFDGAEGMIRGLWSVIKEDIDFGKIEVREYMMEKEGLSGSNRGEMEAVVRMWCDVLKLRV